MKAKMQRPASHTKLVIWLTVAVIAMFGFGYALVPLYNTFCKWWNINGKTNTVAVNISQEAVSIDTSREVTVEFLATNNSTLPWTFKPKVFKIRLHPGEMKRITYFAQNNSGQTMRVQAIPSVTPGLAAKYLKKTECFCFAQQTLAANESMDMPIVFHLDPDLPKDIHTVTLSYTLFDVTHLKASPNNGKVVGRI